LLQKTLCLFILLFSALLGAELKAQSCNCPQQGQRHVQLPSVVLEERSSSGGAPTGCDYYQEIPGFIAGRRYLISFCKDRGFSTAGAVYDTYLRVENSAGQTVAESVPDGSQCPSVPGSSTVESENLSGTPRFYIFKMPGCQPTALNSQESQQTKFSYKEICKTGMLRLQTTGNTVACNTRFSLTYSTPSGASQYQLQFWNGTEWVDYPGALLTWQGDSPDYVFTNITITEKTKFRVKHKGGNCANNAFSNELEVEVSYSCPTSRPAIISPRDKYCTGGVIQMNLDTACFPRGARYEWRGPGSASFPNSSSISFSLPDIINPPNPCSSYTYEATVTFAQFPGCTLQAIPKTISVCKLMPFTIRRSGGSSGTDAVCQNYQYIELEIAPTAPWQISDFQRAINTEGYTFDWDCRSCSPGNTSLRNRLQSGRLSWNVPPDTRGGFKRIEIKEQVADCVNPQEYTIKVECQ
jgi:hypothetical protein